MDYKTRRVIDISYNGSDENLFSGGVSFDDISEMIRLWEAIEMRLNTPDEEGRYVKLNNGKKNNTAPVEPDAAPGAIKLLT